MDDPPKKSEDDKSQWLRENSQALMEERAWLEAEYEANKTMWSSEQGETQDWRKEKTRGVRRKLEWELLKHQKFVRARYGGQLPPESDKAPGVFGMYGVSAVPGTVISGAGLCESCIVHAAYMSAMKAACRLCETCLYQVDKKARGKKRNSEKEEKT